MPKLNCSCGRSVQITESEATKLVGKPFSCPACGRTKRIPTIFKSAENAMPDPEKAFPLAERLRKPQYGISPWVMILLLSILTGVGWGLFWSNSSIFSPKQADAPLQPGENQGGKNPMENPGRIGGILDEMSTKEAVRKYLSENLNDPDYDEVKWWPYCSLSNLLEYTPFSDSDNMRDNLRLFSYNSLWKPITPTGVSVRLKYRAKNSFGMKTIQDTVFLVDEDGNVFRAIKPENIRPKDETPKDYTTRMQSESSTQPAIAGAIELVKGQENIQGFINDLKNSDPKSGKRKPLDPIPHQHRR